MISQPFNTSSIRLSKSSILWMLFSPVVCRQNVDIPPIETLASSSCGICGKATQERIWQHFTPLPKRHALPSKEWVCSTPNTMRQAQQHFDQTGGTHAAALFTRNGALLVLREDVGRHNAVDKVIGWAIQEDIV